MFDLIQQGKIKRIFWDSVANEATGENNGEEVDDKVEQPKNSLLIKMNSLLPEANSQLKRSKTLIPRAHSCLSGTNSLKLHVGCLLPHNCR